MHRKQQSQLMLGEHILYNNLPDDLLSNLNQIIDWKPFESILAKLHPLYVYLQRGLNFDGGGNNGEGQDVPIPERPSTT